MMIKSLKLFHTGVLPAIVTVKQSSKQRKETGALTISLTEEHFSQGSSRALVHSLVAAANGDDTGYH